MSEALKAFIHKRNQELDHDERSLKHRLAGIAAEREQLNKAAAAAGLTLPSIPTGPVGMLSPAYKPPAAEQTIKQLVLVVMPTNGRGMTAQDILAAINKHSGKNYSRTSLSPQLSRLKTEGKLTRAGRIWRLAEPTKKNYTADELAELFEGKAEGA